ncbi:MAG: hypothetical protein U0M06_11635 [Clostridia bacterium]|nr:hypothetical protein [Clostridia bacterium]
MNNQLSPVSWQTLFKKSAVWGVWLFLLALLQTSFFSVIRPFGAVPELVLPAVIAIGIYDKERTGAIAGIVGGYMIDAVGGVGLSLSPPIYMLCGAVSALLVYSVLNRGWFSWFIMTVPSLILSFAVSLISVYLTVPNPNFEFGPLVTGVLLPFMLSSLSVGIVVYLLTKLIWAKYFDNREMTG